MPGPGGGSSSASAGLSPDPIPGQECSLASTHQGSKVVTGDQCVTGGGTAMVSLITLCQGSPGTHLFLFLKLLSLVSPHPIPKHPQAQGPGYLPLTAQPAGWASSRTSPPQSHSLL